MNRLFGLVELHYDKLLHAFVTFALMMFGMLLFPRKTTVLIVLLLQLAKWVRNWIIQADWIKFRDWVFWSESWGDWIANLCGYGLTALYLWLLN